jgi:hypothetical protein
VDFEVKQMGTQPLEKFRAGAVSCAVWENEATVNGRQIEILKATLERRYEGDPRAPANRS